MRLLVMAVILAATLFAWSPSSGPAPASASGVTAVAAGRDHTCAVTTEGGVKCWGRNDWGQLGAETTEVCNIHPCSTTPVNVSGLATGVAAVAAGSRHTCALTTAGGVKCWGSNSYGQLGAETTELCSPPFDIPCSSTPVDVSGLTSGVAAVAAGGFHTCALTTAGGLKCWGVNSFGQLGDGTTTRPTMPVDVVGLESGVAAIATGDAHTCAVTTAGGLKCWGQNWSGQLGDGTSGFANESPTPVDVVGLSSGVASVAAGWSHTCALTEAEHVQCWGDNLHGQLGNGTMSPFWSTVPVDVMGLAGGVAAITARGDHTCALTSASGTKCWGDNWYGQLGNGRSGPYEVSPMAVNVVGLSSGVTTVAAGFHHTCALTMATGAQCWGLNDVGQLGDGTSGVFNTSNTPVEVVGLGPKPIPTPCPPEGCPTPTPTAVLTPAPPPTPDEPQPTPPASAVVLDFDTYPGGDWELASSGGSSYVSGGILTINAPDDYHEFSLQHPDGVWHQQVSNSRGWVIETRMRVDPVTTAPCDYGLKIWAHDHTNLIQVGFSGEEICLIYPDMVRYPMDTTDGFHVYRIESRLDNVKVYMDGDLVIDHTLTWQGGGSDNLFFGDGASCCSSRSYWDYFWYDVTPDVTPADPPPTPTPAPTPDEPRPTPPASVRGDANCDGTVDALDALRILQYVAGLVGPSVCPENADATADGDINSLDALSVFQMVAGII